MFTNQTANLSTLATGLTNLCREFASVSSLDEPQCTQHDHFDQESRIEEAQEFLFSLVKRVDDVDESLVKSTEHLLPTLSRKGASRMTATELAQLLSSLHAIHSHHIQLIEKLLVGPPLQGDTVKTEGRNEVTQTSGDTPHHWSLGMPLEKVVETDYDTDRYSCESAASCLRTTPRTPCSPGTPCTPSLKDLRLSATTASILTLDVESPKHKNIASNLPKSQDWFLDDDNESRNSTKQSDMDYAILQTRLDRAISSSSAAGLKAIRHYHSGMNHDNAVLDVDDESVAYSRQLQDDDEDSEDESTLCPTVVAADRKPKAIERGNHSSTREHYIAEEAVSHYHSAFAQNVIEYSDSQQAASLGEAGNYIKDTVLSPELDVSRQSIFRSQHDISHVVVHATSPSETLLTMDATMLLNDADAISQSSRLVNDAASLGEETPVLDRYRIISDDNSIGFKVVPNARGSHRKTMEDKNLTPHVPMSRAQGFPKTVKFHETVEDENEQQRYRKTPYPDHFANSASVEGGSRSVTQKRSKFFSLTSPFRYDLDKENRKVLHASQNDKTGRQGERPGAINSVSFSLQLPSLKTPSRSSEPYFRKTPYRASNTHVDDDQEDEGKGQGTAPDIAVCFDGRTPLKDTSRPYRKTPRPKIKERLSMESLKFLSETRLDTPARVDHKTFQKTPYASKTGEHVHHQSTRPAVHFADHPDGLVSSTPLSERVTFRKTPYHGSARALDAIGGTDHNSISQWTAPKFANAASNTPKTIRFRANDDAMTSPVSLASDITGLTGVSYSANQRELFPAIEPLDGGKVHSHIEPMKRPRKSASSLIAKIEEDEFEESAPLVKLQFTLDETNRAISALNGAAFLRKDGAGSFVRFTDTEAYKILRNVGFKRRRCKGLLMSLCHWRRLSMKEEEAETDFEVATHYFEIIL